MNEPVPNGPREASSRTKLVLASIVLFAVVVRLWGIGFLLPHQAEPDGVVYDNQVRVLREGLHEEESRRLFAFYPHLVARIAACIPVPDPGDATPRTLEEHLERASAHRRNIRVVVALLSVLGVLGTFALARRFVPDSWALGAAALFAASTFEAWFAQQARPHAPESALALLAVVAAMQVCERGRWRDWIVAGLAAGLAIGCLQNGVAVLPAIALAGLLRWRWDGARVLVGGLIVLAILGASVLAFYPFLFVHDGRGGVGVVEEAPFLQLSGHLVDLGLFNGKGFATVVRAFWEYDPVISALGTGGIAAAIAMVVARGLRRRSGAASDAGMRTRNDLLVALAFVVPYFLVIGLYQRTYQRFALLLVPYLALAVVWLGWRMVVLASRLGAAARVVAGAACLLVLGVQVLGVVRLSQVRSRPDTLRETARFVEERIGTQSRIAVLPTIDLPLMQSPEALLANKNVSLDAAYPWYTYQWQLPPGAFTGATYDLRAMQLETDAKRDAARADPPGFVAGLDADYAVLEVHSRGRRPLLVALRDAIRAKGELVARISPDGRDVGVDLPLLYQDDEFPETSDWAWRAVHARCVGPVVEIYRLR